MKTVYSGALAGALLVAAMPACAQTAPTATLAPAPQTAPIAVAPGTAQNPNVLRVGTPIAFKMAETITTKGKKLESGYRVHLEVMEPVMVNGVVAIPAGSPAIGEVTDVRNKGMWGKSGRINARLLYVTVGSRQIRLSGVFDDKGVTGTAGVVAAIAFVPIAGFFTTGTSATLPLGASVKGFIDEEVALSVATPATEPAPAPAPAPTPAATATTPATAQTATLTK
jgi:hypothetical protein